MVGNSNSSCGENTTHFPKMLMFLILRLPEEQNTDNRKIMKNMTLLNAIN